MTFKIKKSGTFSDPTFVKRRSGGTWTDVSFVKVKKSGVWEQVWPITPPGALVSINDQTVNRIASTATQASYILNSSGIVQKTEGASTTTLETWLIMGAAGDYEVRATVLAGDSPSGSALATWLALSTTRTWTLQDIVSDPTVVTCDLLIEIRDVATSTVQDTATIIITSERI